MSSIILNNHIPDQPDRHLSQKFRVCLVRDRWLYSSYCGALVFTGRMALLLKKLCDVRAGHPPARWRRLSTFTPALGQSNRALQCVRPQTRAGPLLLSPTACVAPHHVFVGRHWRSYATKSPGGGGGGGGGGFPGFSLGPQHQKGEALKEYVCFRFVYSDLSLH